MRHTVRFFLITCLVFSAVCNLYHYTTLKIVSEGSIARFSINRCPPITAKVIRPPPHHAVDLQMDILRIQLEVKEIASAATTEFCLVRGAATS